MHSLLACVEKDQGAWGRALDKNVDFKHVGNVYDRAKFLLFSKILPYPLTNVCKKAHVLVNTT